MALHDVIERIGEDILLNSAHLAKLNEADARREYVDPILAQLGWEGIERVKLEYNVKADGNRFVDYALLGTNGTPIAFVEAKAPQKSLARYVSQVLQYAFWEGVDICVLTTGAEWWLYLPRERGEPGSRKFAELNLKWTWAAEHHSETLERCLGYESLTTGTAESIAKVLLKERKDEERLLAEIPAAWQRLVTRPSGDLIDLIVEEVHEALGTRPTINQIQDTLPKLFTEYDGPFSSDRPVWKSHRKPLPVLTAGWLRTAQGVASDVCRAKLTARSREQQTTLAKNLVMYLACEHTQSSYSEIASLLGLTNHASVVQGYSQIRELLRTTDPFDSMSAETRRLHEEICKRLEL